MKIEINYFGEVFKCNYIFDTDEGEGVEIREDDNLIGTLFGIDFPDIDDQDEIDIFTDEITDFLIDLGY